MKRRRSLIRCWSVLGPRSGRKIAGKNSEVYQGSEGEIIIREDPLISGEGKTQNKHEGPLPNRLTG